ncbi:MAG TPA: phenylalanine--tRNA ligase beta subunit-related protein [Ramlibacter sp.]|jgi:DNA/RNA-binding domain of Phe-tRNA-synthetase-like protein|nr:phenylalanine--tRNA ligase beta subunit-related protein [Ramlibacter sp.]
MNFSHHPALWAQYPELAAGALFARGIHRDVDAGAVIARHEATASQRLAQAGSESELPEIQAWRRAFSRMGLKPTQYRCASESLLRRFKKEGAMPRIHPLIDACNSISMAFAIPIAVIDLDRVAGDLQVRHADGSERYLTFGGETEHPEPGEVSFVDAQGNAHARRWTNRQSGLSAVRDATTQVLIVAEAMHAGAAQDVARLLDAVQDALRQVWGVEAQRFVLGADKPTATS